MEQSGLKWFVKPVIRITPPIIKINCFQENILGDCSSAIHFLS